MYDVTTTDLKDFGFNEIKELRDILDAWVEGGLPDDFTGDQVHPMFNRNSGNVFLTNSDCDVCMVADGVLCSWYSCPECGHEGFAEDMRADGQECCNEYMNERLPA